MIDFFDRIYIRLDNSNKLLNRIGGYRIMRFTIRVLANIILPLYFKATARKSCNKLHPCSKTSDRLIVTLTSFPARINHIWMVIETLLRQTVKPDMLILWLSKKQFPKGIDDLPPSLLRQTERGLTIRMVDDDYRSHKKYHYCLKEFPNDHIITVDDDVFYDTRLVERMKAAHRENPHAVITNKAHQMTYTADGHLKPYSDWNYNTHSDSALFVIGAGGNLYPAKCMDAMAVDIETAMRLTPTGDDIWLNAMVRLHGTPIVHTHHYFLEQIPVINFRNVTLNTTNLASANDIQINGLCDYLMKQNKGCPFQKA